MMQFHGKINLPEHMKVLTSCPFCGASMEKLDIRLLKEMHDRELVHVHCEACLGSIIALLLMTGPGIASIGLVTDLSFDDMVKSVEEREVSLDDVLGMHELLKSPRFLKKLQVNCN
jgi:uncharacterized Zn finger protein